MSSFDIATQFYRCTASGRLPVQRPDTLQGATALIELGLKLESTRVERDTVIVDRIGRPAEN